MTPNPERTSDVSEVLASGSGAPHLVDDWLAPGRRVVEGYLHVVRGPRKRRGSLFDEIVMDAIEATGRTLPRFPDLHAVWSSYDPDGPEGHQLQRPFLRYKASRPIDGLDRSCQFHRVEVTCTVGERWSNGLGAFITRASGRCLECVEPAAEPPKPKAEDPPQ